MKMFSLIPALIAAFASSAYAQTVVAEGLQFPQKLTVTSSGSILVTEGGTTTVNTGRVSILPKGGTRRSLVEGLPAARGHGVPAFGPAGIVLDGRTLYVVIGEGDINVGPPFSLNPNWSSSPIFASVLRIQFPVDVDLITSPFQIGDAHQALADGFEMEVRNASGDRAKVYVLTAFRPIVRNILGPAGTTRVSDPYTAVLDAPNKTLYVVDSSSETISKIDTSTGHATVMIRFQQDVRGNTTADTVPTAMCLRADNSVLISFLSGAPFPVGAGSIRRWTPADTGWAKLSPLIGGLTSVVDMTCLDGPSGSTPKIVTVEFWLEFPNQTVPSGRIQLLEGSTAKILADKVAQPTGVAQDPSTGELLVVTLAGQVLRFPKP